MGNIQKKKAAVDNLTKSLRLKYKAVQQEYAKAELRLQEELGRSRRAFATSLAEIEKLNAQIVEEQTYLLNIAEVQVVSRCDYLTMRIKQTDIALLEEGSNNEEEELDLKTNLPVILKLQDPEFVKTECSKALDIGQLTTKPCTVNAEEEDRVDFATSVATPLDIYRDIDMETAVEEAVCASPGSFKSKSVDEGGPSPGASGGQLCQL